MIENIYNIRKKTAFVLGDQAHWFRSYTKTKIIECKTINLDIVNKDKLIIFINSIILKAIYQKLQRYYQKFGLPDIFINCAYPKTKDWSQNNFNKIKIDS